MTAPLRHVPIPGNSRKQAGEIWFVHSDECLFIITVEPDGSSLRRLIRSMRDARASGAEAEISPGGNHEPG
jgi:hypothetical protein